MADQNGNDSSSNDDLNKLIEQIPDENPKTRPIHKGFSKDEENKDDK